jgi:hypothetical protein
MQESYSVPKIILEEAEESNSPIIACEKVFPECNDWKEKRGVMTINEEVLLSYFLNLKKYAISFHFISDSADQNKM